MKHWVSKGNKNPDRWMDKHPNWKGGRRLDERGYVRIQQGFKKEAYEHRLVMEDFLGRQLERDEVVHHKDGNKSNNSLENLEVLSRSEHTRIERRLVLEG